jgi:hypothetical protein
MANETSKTICDILEKLFCAEGSPGMLITDNAQNLTSDEIKRLLERWGVVGKTLPRYSPWYGGWYERGHQTLMKCLSALVMESGCNWKKKLQEAVLYYNTRPFEYDDGTGLSPHEVFRGRRLWNPWNSPVGGIDAVHGELRDHAVAVVRERERIGSLFEEIWIRCREAVMKEIKRKQKGSEKFKVGDYVYVFVPPELRENKLDVRWEGPYRIDKVLSSVVYQIGNKIEHILNLKRAFVEEVVEDAVDSSSDSSNHSMILDSVPGQTQFERPEAVNNPLVHGADSSDMSVTPNSVAPQTRVECVDASDLPAQMEIKVSGSRSFDIGVEANIKPANHKSTNCEARQMKDMHVGVPPKEWSNDTGVNTIPKSFANLGVNTGSERPEQVRIRRMDFSDDYLVIGDDDDTFGGKRKATVRKQPYRRAKQARLSTMVAVVLAHKPKGDFLWI